MSVRDEIENTLLNAQAEDQRLSERMDDLISELESISRDRAAIGSAINGLLRAVASFTDAEAEGGSPASESSPTEPAPAAPSADSPPPAPGPASRKRSPRLAGMAGKGAERRQRIVDHVRRHPGQSQDEIRRAVEPGTKPDAFRSLITRATRDGQIQGRGATKARRYYVPEADAAPAQDMGSRNGDGPRSGRERRAYDKLQADGPRTSAALAIFLKEAQPRVTEMLESMVRRGVLSRGMKGSDRLYGVAAS
jgi:hypothetical protein